MKPLVYRIAGIVLIAGAVLGLLANIAGLFYLLNTREGVTDTLTNEVALINQSLQTTSQSLNTVSGAIQNARDNLKVVRTSMLDMATAIEQTSPSFDEMNTLVSFDLPNIITNTRGSLSTAAESARVVDDTLRIISAIPFIGARYKPNVPLQQSVNDVSDSLKTLPESFTRLQKGIKTSQDNLNGMKNNIYDLAGQLNRFDNDLIDAQRAVSQYQDIVGQLSEQGLGLETKLPVYINRFYLVITIVLLWLVLAQLAMFIQGIELYERATNQNLMNI